MKIRPILKKDRGKIYKILKETNVFNTIEIEVAMELVDIYLKNKKQRDYIIYCFVDNKDLPIGYICYGPSPMTQSTFDLYWIVVDPKWQNKGVGSNLLKFLEEVVKRDGGRMILVETSSTPEYERARRFYNHNGFTEVARILDYYYPGNDMITFCKRI